ncbi:MAG: hypothetical protein Q8O74_09960, partial [bacterium]|nr:hypothetical protein [bacterium]
LCRPFACKAGRVAQGRLHKKNQKEKSSSLKTIQALRFSLLVGLSELGLWPSPQTADKPLSPSTAMLTDSFNATTGDGTC